MALPIKYNLRNLVVRKGTKKRRHGFERIRGESFDHIEQEQGWKRIEALCLFIFGRGIGEWR